MSTPIFQQSEVLCAEQVEIFVPKNEDYLGKMKLFFDHLILQNTVPMAQEHGKWLQRLAEQYQAAGGAPNLFARKTHWENLIFGYSLYETQGYFIGTDEQSQRTISQYFEEATLVIKLILTNYHTRGLRYPLAQTLPNPFGNNTPELFIGQAIHPSASAEHAALMFEYATTMLHYMGTTAYIFHQLSHDIMHDEYEIWLQRWPTQLSRKFKSESREVPVAMNEQEKSQKFGEHWQDVLCVIDYIHHS